MTAPLDVLASFSRDTGGFRCTNKQAKELAEACAAVAQLVEDVDRVAAFLVGWGDTAEVAASQLRAALAKFGGAA